MKSEQKDPRILLILDLDETLIHVAEHPSPPFLNSKAAFQVGGFLGVPRPHLQTFLEETAAHFQMAIFSSAGALYVHDVVNKTIRPFVEAAGHKLQFVWGNERCTLKRDLELDRYYWVKNLQKVKRQGFSIERMLLVDDTPEKAKLNYGNYIRIRPFFGDPADEELLHLARYLSSLRGLENVRHVDKRTWRQDLP